jgi:Rhodopirellula transposase DDE domain
MPEARVIEWIRQKYANIAQDLDERGRRRWAASEALSLGRGGISAVAVATGISDRTIRNGIRELNDPNPLPPTRRRRLGGGRKSRTDEQPGLVAALEKLVEPDSRGDPQSPLRWTCKSTRALARALKADGFEVSRTKVGQLLKSSGFSLQSNRKTREGTQHPDRNAQFEHIAKRVRARQRCGEPALSVDTKKKEVLGNLKNPGKTYRRKRNPVKVNVHDFPDPELGKAIPYGVYDLSHNEAGVSVGITHDTAEFAVEAIRRWWYRLGTKRYRNPRRLLITADSGGSNSSRNRLWKTELQMLADETGMIIEVCHFPPGTSKWNKIEHRVFCHITRNWRGVPLETVEIVVKLIGSTRTKTGLEVHCWLDEDQYDKGRKVTDAEMQELLIKPNAFHGEWNYEIQPRTQHVGQIR